MKKDILTKVIEKYTIKKMDRDQRTINETIVYLVIFATMFYVTYQIKEKYDLNIYVDRPNPSLDQKAVGGE